MGDVGNIASGAADVLNLALRIITRTQDAKGRANGLPELLDKHADELRSAKSMLEVIQKEPSLRTPDVQVTVATIHAAARSLYQFLAAQKTALEKGNVQGYLRQLFRGSQDLERLDAIMDKLTRAKMDLGAKIQLVNAGMMGQIGSTVRINTQAVEEMNGRVQALLGSDRGQKYAEQGRGRQEIERGVTALAHDDIVAIAASRGSSLISRTANGSSHQGARGKVRIITNNIALKDSLQVNAPIGKDEWFDLDVMAVHSNVADVGSVQFNYPINSSDFLAALRIKYGRD